MTIKKIAILTGGGDCPGLNAVIRAVTRKAIHEHDWEVVGILDGYEGAVLGHARNLTHDDVANILGLGGTILGTSNKADPFAFQVNGSEKRDLSRQLVEHLKRWNVDALIAVGGDGTLTCARQLTELFPHIVGVPKTIDNDLSATDQTFGFDTACNIVTEAIDRIHTTAQAHHRVMVVEVMGRYAGWIALEGGMAGGGDVILLPELPFSWDRVCATIRDRSRRGRRATIVVVAEGAHAEGEDLTVRATVKDSPDPVRLGGIGERVANVIERETGHESRVTVLGHLQRGGAPSFYDRVLATRYGAMAVELVASGQFGMMTALRGQEIVAASLSEATGSLKRVTREHPLVATAQAVGTSFGI